MKHLSKKIWITFLLILLIGIAVFGGNIANAINTLAEGFRATSASVMVDATPIGGDCKVVQPTDGKDYFVPTKTLAEWNIFKANKPSTVNLSECRSFTTVWRVGTTGYGNGSNTVSFSTMIGAIVDWGDGTVEKITTSTPSHTYAIAGDYTIKISSMTRFYNPVSHSNSFGKLIAVTDWGGVKWTSMDYMFAYANNFNQIPTDAPDLSLVTNMS